MSLAPPRFGPVSSLTLWRTRFIDRAEGQRWSCACRPRDELAALPCAAVVVEERYGTLVRQPRVRAGWLCELVAQLQVRYPGVPIVFADSRKLAEDWTHASSRPPWPSTPHRRRSKTWHHGPPRIARSAGPRRWARASSALPTPTGCRGPSLDL